MHAIVFTSVPKCGTHILLRYFPLMGFTHAGPVGAVRWSPSLLDYVRDVTEGAFCAWHYPWTEDLSGVVADRCARVVFLYRDPRAQVVSRVHFIMKTPDHPWHRVYTEELRNHEERLCRTIVGFRDVHIDYRRRGLFEPCDPDGQLARCPLGVQSQFPPFEGWLTDPSCLSLRFEDIIGPRGGGDRDMQLQTLASLMAFTGTGENPPPEDLTAEAVADAIYDTTAATFRLGRIDAWRDEFTPTVERTFMETFGDQLQQWGYQP